MTQESPLLPVLSTLARDNPTDWLERPEYSTIYR
ncbi:unnamed protein product [Ectocarpus sp. 8 AP-2014]